MASLLFKYNPLYIFSKEVKSARDPIVGPPDRPGKARCSIWYWIVDGSKLRFWGLIEKILFLFFFNRDFFFHGQHRALQ